MKRYFPSFSTVLAALLLSVTFAANGFAQTVRVKAEDSGLPYSYILVKNIKEGGKHPLILSLHGMNEGKPGVEGVNFSEEKIFADSGHSYIYLKPVTPAMWSADDINKIVEAVQKEHQDIIDPKRLYVFGFSMGGTATWEYGISHGDKVAAAMPIQGGFIFDEDPVSKYDFSNFKNIPLWVFHNQDDPVVKPVKATELVDEVKRLGGTAQTSFPATGGHTPNFEGRFTKEVIDWLFAQSR